MKKMLMVFVAVAVLMANSVNAEDKLSVSITSLVLSRYIGGAGSLVYDKPVLQSDIFISFPKSFYIDIWHSGDLAHGFASPNYGNEIDWTAGYAPGFKWGQIDVGISFIDEPKLFRFKKGEEYAAPYAEVRRGIGLGKRHTLIPYVRTELILPMTMKWEGREERYFLGTRHQWKVASWLILKSNLVLVHSRANEGVMGRYDLFVNWPITKKITLITPAIKTALPISGVAKSHHSEIAVGGGITFNF
jgi:hypothetical protein